VAIPAETPICAWTNSQPDLAGPGQPLELGAYTKLQRSPDIGCYAVIARTPGGGGSRDVVAEQDANIDVATITATIFGPTLDAAENAAAAWATAAQNLTGDPAACGDTGVTILAAYNVIGPSALPGTGEIYAFLVVANFILATL